MIDVKKLISGFLVIAVAAIASGVILAYAGGSTSVAKTPTAPQILGIDATNSGATADNGAFADNTNPQDSVAALQAELDTTSTQAQASDPDNLTNLFANSLVSGFVAANPDGIQTDSSGNDNVSMPDSQTLAADITSNAALQNFKAPNWDTEVGKDKILINGDNSTTSINLYISALKEVYQKYIGSSDIGSILGDENAGDAPILSGRTQKMLKVTESLPVPSSLVNFHVSLIKLLFYEENSALVIQNETNDPIRASLILQAEQPKYNLAVSNFETQWEKAAGGQSFPKGASLNSNSLQSDPQTSDTLSFVDNLLGIQIANAQIAAVVSDPITEVETTAVDIGTVSIDSAALEQLPLQARDTATSAAIFSVENGILALNTQALAQTVWKYAQDIALQITINTLTTLMQRKVLTWIQGSGAPRFIQNWGAELATSFTTAATNKLNSWMQCVPSFQAPTLKLLLTTPSTANTSACGTMFNAQLSNNLQNLSSRFSNFNDYLNLFQPGGNTWGLVMQVQDSALLAGAASQAAQTNQSIAQQGWKGSAVCDDGSNPNGLHTVCESSDGKNYTLSPGETCDPSDVPTPFFNGGSCADGSSPQVTSPGQVTGQSFAAALKSGADNITSAKNIAGILNALASSLLNTLSQAAIKFSTQQLNNGLNGGGSGVTDSGVIGINPASVAIASSTQNGVQCIPATQTSSLVDNSTPTAESSGTPPSLGQLTANTSSSQATASFSAAGGAIDTNCASGGACPATENFDGSPVYRWSAPGSVQAAGGVPVTGTSFFATYNIPGTYVVTVTASTDGSASTCDVTVQ